mgnify:CR=1 FL=1
MILIIIKKISVVRGHGVGVHNAVCNAHVRIRYRAVKVEKYCTECHLSVFLFVVFYQPAYRSNRAVYRALAGFAALVRKPRVGALNIPQGGQHRARAHSAQQSHGEYRRRFHLGGQAAALEIPRPGVGELLGNRRVPRVLSLIHI